MNDSRLVVLKFGGSVLESERSLRPVIHEIYRCMRGGDRVIAVVSALAGETDRLLARAERYGPTTDAHAVAQLVATGELSSAALLALALDRAGIPAAALDAAAIGLRSEGDPLDAVPATVDSCRLRRALEQRPVVVVPGFIGRDDHSRPALFGRGGSDLTALFLADALGADQCRLIKDVDGLYEWDPAAPGPGPRPGPRRFRTISWRRALTLDGSIVQHKAVRFAQDRHMAFEVRGLHAATATVVGGGPDRLAGPDVGARRPLRVSLLGLGTVGLGVYRAMSRLPHLFEVVSIAVRDRARAVRAGVPEQVVTSDVLGAAGSDCDAVVEAIGGVFPARDAIGSALDQGRDVVTANKTVLAGFGAQLESAAHASGACLLFSAAAGGAVPILEMVRRIATSGRIRSLEAVLNGTSNYVLDELDAGTPMDQAVAKATKLGFAERDAARDLDGRDAADKLVLIHHAWTNRWLSPRDVHRTATNRDTIRAVSRSHTDGTVIRQVARLRVCGPSLAAEVRPVAVRSDHPLARARGESNAAVIRETDDATHVVAGRGAGRWPTAEAVIADLIDLVARSGHAGSADSERLVGAGCGRPRK